LNNFTDKGVKDKLN